MTRPEVSVMLAAGHVGTRERIRALSSRGVPVLLNLSGLAFVAVADNASRAGKSSASTLFWIGLLFIYVPVAARLLMGDTSRRERLASVTLLGLSLYLVKILASPDSFYMSDEYIHLRGIQDILATRHLFSPNPLLPTAPDYPGLAATTAGLSGMTGLSPVAVGFLIIGLARVLISVSLFLVAERITGSERAAGVACLIYMANPMFLFWSSAFAYENLGLPLAACAVWWCGRTLHEDGLAPPILTTTLIVAVTVTHHVAGFALSALFTAWYVAECVTRQASLRQRRVGLAALVSVGMTSSWLASVATPTATYLFSDNLVPALRQTRDLLVGVRPPRSLYSSGGHSGPTWETIAGFVSVALLLLALLPALYLAWGHRRRAPVIVAMVVAALYPVSLVPRLAPIGVAISGRSSEYVFTGLACVVALLAVETHTSGSRQRHPWQVTARLREPWQVVAGTVLVTLVFVGQVTIGTAYNQRLPEAKAPSGYPWSVQPDVVAASRWAQDHLGAHRRFGASTVDSNALATYGEQDTVPESDTWPVFFATTMDADTVRAIRAEGIEFVLVDWRMTRGLPPGYYFSPDEPGAAEYKQRFPTAALLKFTAGPCTRVLYASGAVEIVDLSAIQNGFCVPDAHTHSLRARRPQHEPPYDQGVAGRRLLPRHPRSGVAGGSGS